MVSFDLIWSEYCIQTIIKNIYVTSFPHLSYLRVKEVGTEGNALPIKQWQSNCVHSQHLENFRTLITFLLAARVSPN